MQRRRTKKNGPRKRKTSLCLQISANTFIADFSVYIFLNHGAGEETFKTSNQNDMAMGGNVFVCLWDRLVTGARVCWPMRLI